MDFENPVDIGTAICEGFHQLASMVITQKFYKWEKQ